MSENIINIIPHCHRAALLLLCVDDLACRFDIIFAILGQFHKSRYVIHYSLSVPHNYTHVKIFVFSGTATRRDLELFNFFRNNLSHTRPKFGCGLNCNLEKIEFFKCNFKTINAHFCPCACDSMNPANDFKIKACKKRAETKNRLFLIFSALAEKVQ